LTDKNVLERARGYQTGVVMKIPKEKMKTIYVQMYRSRVFEERVNEMFMKG
jgi:TPP-dependent pyruvate/acetoin dehydrogenase alpha subunit